LQVYLDSSEVLKPFPYSNELFHASTNVLNVLMQRLPQEAIDINMENRLELIKEKKLESVQILLEHLDLEVIISWLVRSSNSNHTMAVVDYVKRYTMFMLLLRCKILFHILILLKKESKFSNIYLKVIRRKQFRYNFNLYHFRAINEGIFS